MSLLDKLKKFEPKRQTNEDDTYAEFCIDVYLAKKAGYKNAQIAEVAGKSYSEISSTTVALNRCIGIIRAARKRGLSKELGLD